MTRDDHDARPPAASRPRSAGESGRRSTRWYAQHYDPIQAGSIDGSDTTPHDKALVRAMRARFDPTRDPQIRGDAYKTLFVGRLSFATSEATLRTFFERYGPIHHLRLVVDCVTLQSKGYAFIEFDHERDFARAFRDAHGQQLDGQPLLVDYERSRVMRGWKPRRLGGGLGGRKESGQLRFGGRELPFRPPRHPPS